MTEAISWIAIVAVVASPAIILASRTFLIARIKESVRADFEGRLEGLRSELRQSEEAFRADLRAKELQLAAIRDGALEGRAKRQAVLATRRIEALESVWAKFNKLAALKFAAYAYSRMKIEKIEERVSHDANLREFLETFSGGDPVETLKDTSGSSERIHIPDIVWAIYTAYQAILMTCHIHMKTMAMGIDNGSQFINWDKVADLTKAVLPHQTTYIGKYGSTGLPHLLDEIEEKMLTSVRSALSGEEEDAATIVQSAEIMKKAEMVVSGLDDSPGGLTA